MPGLEHGFSRGMSEVIGGIVTMVLVINFAQNINPSVVPLFKMGSFVSLIGIILAMPYWGSMYLLGWTYAIFIMFEAGFVSILELIVFIGVPFFILAKRFSSSLV